MKSLKKHLSLGVLALPINRHGQFLITLRHDPQEPAWHNKWQATGGKLKFGETPEQALQREIKEELFVSIRILYPFPIAKTYTWHLKNSQVHVLLLCYIVDIGHQQPQVDGTENAKCRWIFPEEINHLAILPLTDDFIFEAKGLVEAHNLISQLS